MTVDKQHEIDITIQKPLLDTKGRLVEPGYSTQNLSESKIVFNHKNIPALIYDWKILNTYMYKKYYNVATIVDVKSGQTIEITIIDLGWVSYCQVDIYDLKKFSHNYFTLTKGVDID